MWRERFAEPPPEEVRDRLREIFRRAEFQRAPTWWDRLVRRIAEWLSGLFGDGGTTPGWGGPAAELILWIVVVALVVALLAVVVVVVRRRVRRAEREPIEVDVEVHEERSVDEWSRLAADHEATGRWKEALRCRYRALVGSLVEHGVVSPVPGRTTGELRADVTERAPAVASDFSEATLLFELAWYADRPTGSAERARFAELAASTLAGARRAEREPVGATS